MDKKLPVLAWRTESEDNEGFRLSVAMDELAEWARENGYTADDLRERFEESLERYDEGNEG